jgi:hypothetical protein
MVELVVAGQMVGVQDSHLAKDDTLSMSRLEIAVKLPVRSDRRQYCQTHPVHPRQMGRSRMQGRLLFPLYRLGPVMINGFD